MPKWLICIPLVVQWLWLTLRYRSATLPSSANPNITAGGLVGEGKLEYFHGMGALAHAVTARHCAITTEPMPEDKDLLSRLVAAGLNFPLIAKPDLGLCGYGVRRINHLTELRDYLTAFPRNETVVLQQYLSQEGEAGIFYARDPHTDQGRIIGLALRYFARVTGDGKHTIAQLIAADARSQRALHTAQHTCELDPSWIPERGQVVRLSTIGSTRVGGLYRDGAALISPQLTAAIDVIARDMPEFYCGRFDVRFDSLHNLSAGQGFTIMEINGAGSEAIEAWDPDIGLVAAFKMIFAKQRLLFAIGHARRCEGVKPIGLIALAGLYFQQQRLIARYPPSN